MGLSLSYGWRYIGEASAKDTVMPQLKTNLAKLDPVWAQIRGEAEEAVKAEPLLGGLVHACILHHNSIEKALAYRISTKLASS